MADLEPDAYRELRDLHQIKAVADPLRIRILHLLGERPATNQQAAVELGESPARVFHHLRSLLDANLIHLVETRIRGKNVEYFYRAVARNFILRPGDDLLPQTRIATLGAELDRVRHESLESAATWAEEPPRLLRQVARLRPEQLAAFHERLHGLIREYWDVPAGDNRGLPTSVLTVLIYREPAKWGESHDGASDG